MPSCFCLRVLSAYLISQPICSGNSVRNAPGVLTQRLLSADPHSPLRPCRPICARSVESAMATGCLPCHRTPGSLLIQTPRVPGHSSHDTPARAGLAEPNKSLQVRNDQCRIWLASPVLFWTSGLRFCAVCLWAQRQLCPV